MVSATPSQPRKAVDEARRLALALDAIEAELDMLNLGAPPDQVAAALAGPVRQFDAAAEEIMR